MRREATAAAAACDIGKREIIGDHESGGGVSKDQGFFDLDLDLDLCFFLLRSARFLLRNDDGEGLR